MAFLGKFAYESTNILGRQTDKKHSHCQGESSTLTSAAPAEVAKISHKNLQDSNANNGTKKNQLDETSSWKEHASKSFTKETAKNRELKQS